MLMMMMLSMLIQVWATLSEEERESRRAQMRDHSAQVIDNSNQFYVGIHLTWVVFWHIFSVSNSIPVAFFGVLGQIVNTKGAHFNICVMENC